MNSYNAKDALEMLQDHMTDTALEKYPEPMFSPKITKPPITSAQRQIFNNEPSPKVASTRRNLRADISPLRHGVTSEEREGRTTIRRNREMYRYYGEEELGKTVVPNKQKTRNDRQVF